MEYMTREELTREEAKDLEITDFLKELVDIIAKRFDKQKADIADLQRSLDRIKEDDVIELRRCMYEIKERLATLNDKIDELAEKEKKISRDILGAIIE